MHFEILLQRYPTSPFFYLTWHLSPGTGGGPLVLESSVSECKTDVCNKVSLDKFNCFIFDTCKELAGGQVNFLAGDKGWGQSHYEVMLLYLCFH